MLKLQRRILNPNGLSRVMLGNRGNSILDASTIIDSDGMDKIGNIYPLFPKPFQLHLG